MNFGLSPQTFKVLKLTTIINGLSLATIPLLAACLPRVIEISDKKSVVKIRLGWRTRNHLKVMYFGALAMGAELSVALQAIDSIAESGQKIDFIFKDFSAEFLQRTDGHALFICEEAAQVRDLVAQAVAGSERVQQCFSGYAVLASNPDKIVMRYKLTLSMKKRSSKS